MHDVLHLRLRRHQLRRCRQHRALGLVPPAHEVAEFAHTDPAVDERVPALGNAAQVDLK